MFTTKKTTLETTSKSKDLVKLESYLESFKVEDTPTLEMPYNGETITIRSVRVTPSLASKIMEDHNKKNRKINKNNVRFLTKEIESNNWIPNGETISFDINGNVNNGQHRLLAIIKSGVSLDILIVTNLSLEAFKTIDTGALRSGSDVLSIEGVSNSTHIAAMVKFIFAFKIGKYSANRHHHRTLSNTELIDYYYELGDDKVYSSYQFYNSVRDGGSSVITPTLISGFHFLLTEIDKEKGEEFLTMLTQGINLTKDSPITALRNKLIKSRVDKNYKLTNEELLKNITYAWSKYLKNEKAKSLKLPANYEVSLETELNSQRTLEM
jgi:hypothetical protein